MVLTDLLRQRRAYAEHDGERFLDAVQNARLVTNAEQSYRIMYYGSLASWNLRDSHMFKTLKTLLAFYGPKSKAIIWAHNSHIGDASATEMSFPRRVQYRPPLSRGIRRPGLCDRLRHQRRYRSGGVQLGWTDGDQASIAGNSREL